MLGTLLPIYDLPDFPYREGRIVPFASRPVKKTQRSVFGGRVMRRGRR